VTILEVPEQTGTVECHKYFNDLSFEVSTTYITKKNVYDECVGVLEDDTGTNVVVEV
jgi:hypothetical protein